MKVSENEAFVIVSRHDKKEVRDAKPKESDN